MIRHTLLTVAEALAGFVRDLGLAGFVLCFAALLLFAAAMKFLDFTAEALDEVMRVWRRCPPWFRRSVVVLVAWRAVPFVWAIFPWRAALLAALCAGLCVLSAGGFVYGQRYGVHDSPWAAWAYHLRVTAKRRRLGKGIDTGTAKKNAKATRLRLRGDADEAVVQPPDGLSARDLAEAINKGELHSAVARQLGWRDVKDMSAIPQADGTVLVRVAHQVRHDVTLEPEWVAP